MTTYSGNQNVTFGDAKHGATVLLDDNTEAVLQHINRTHTRATIRVGHKHYRIHADRIVSVIRRGDQPQPTAERVYDKGVPGAASTARGRAQTPSLERDPR